MSAAKSKSAPVVALFPGSFDPVTAGHLNLVQRGVRVFDRVVVGLVDGQGHPMFTTEERMALMREVLDAHDLGAVEVVCFRGLVVEAAREHGASVLLRGIRSTIDWEYEMRMAFANHELAPAIETVFLPPSPSMPQISGTLVREVARLGGDVSSWVHPSVAKALQAKLGS